MTPHNSSTSSFKIFAARYVLPVLLLSSVIVGVAGFLFERYVILGSSLSGSFKVNRVLQQLPSHEVAIVGSSRAQGGYIPDSLGPDVFNYGIDGTGMNVHLFFLKELLQKHSNTPIILNIDMDGFFESDGDLSNYIYNASEVESAGFLKSKIPIIRKIPVIKYYGYFDQYAKYFLNERINATKLTNNGGSFELNPTDSHAFQNAVKKRYEKPAQFYSHSRLQASLEELISCSGNRPIYLVVAPYHPSYKSTFANKDDFYSYYRQFEKYSNVKFIDCSEILVDDSCFFNTTHLTLKGAREFTSHLRKIIF